MNEYVIGVDIGGTKSHLAIFDTRANFLDLCHWGPLNHEVLPGSFAQFEEEFNKFLTGMMQKHDIAMEQIKYSMLGVAGVDTKVQHEKISGILRKTGLKNFTLTNDAFLGIPAGNKSGKGTGICAINGTGCTLAGINREGRMMQIGGVGIFSSDMGGGNYIGGQLLSAVYRELFRKGEATLMTELLFNKLNVKSKYDYLETLLARVNEGNLVIGSLNSLVFEAAAKGDHEAASILQNIAANYAGGILCMMEELSFPSDEELIIVFAGSVFVKGEHPFLLDKIKEKIVKGSPAHNVKYIKLEVPNVTGAVVWALNSLLGKNNLYDKVYSQLLK